MISVEVLVGPPGCGKTKELLAEMAGVAGRYVFALPTTDLIKEKLVELRREAAESGTEPVIRAIHSKVAGRATQWKGSRIVTVCPSTSGTIEQAISPMSW